jgi:hypothetical protein
MSASNSWSVIMLLFDGAMLILRSMSSEVLGDVVVVVDVVDVFFRNRRRRKLAASNAKTMLK